MKRPYMKIISTAVSAILLTNSAAVAGLTFGDWATAQGYTPPGPTDWECDASNKGITTAEGANSYINLLELNLWGNQIPSLSVDHFQGLTNLQTLRVGDNQITSLSANQFQALTSLQRLFISHNQIPSVDVQAFQGLSDLTMLYLGNNQLSSLSSWRAARFR